MKNKRNISFVTPFLSGLNFLNLHLASFRKFYPDAEILISSPDNLSKDICAKYDAKLFVEDLDWKEAIESLLGKAENELIVISNHDTVLLNNIDDLLSKLNNFDLIGIEERIKFIDKPLWFRHAPGYMDLTFMIFEKSKAIKNNPYWPKFPPFDIDRPKYQNVEEHYGFCELMPKHYYLRPFAAQKYGRGNLIKDGAKNILWHQWFGSWEKRGSFISEKDRADKPYNNILELKTVEENFIKDYPSNDFNKVQAVY